MSQEFLPYGSQYYRTPNPPRKDWERDLCLMKARGMNTVRLWAMWSWIHCPGDRFDFSELNDLMSLCRRIGLKALVQVILENAPAWLVAKHPDARYAANDGQQIQPMGRPNTPGGGWPGLCLDNPPARAAAEKFMTALSENVAGDDALLGYDVWNEVWFELDGYIGGQYYCYCDGTIERFRAFLRDKYGDLDGLGKAWYRRYSAWEEVHPPRYWGGYPDWIDWIKFRIANQGALLRWRVETLRRTDPRALLVSHGLPTTLESMCGQLTDDWRNAAEVDVYGLSCFPLWFNYDNIDTFKVHDMLRGACSGKTFWTAETQAGASGEGLMHSPAPKPEDIRLWNWISLASGAKGVMYWQWRPELLGPESPGFGLCNLDGSPTERTDAASYFARLTYSLPELTAGDPIPGEVAIVVLPESQIFCHVSDRNAGKYAESVRGAYKALSEAGYQVDFARPDQISGYSLIYLPFPLMIEPQNAAILADFVKRGGTLISEACPALFGEAGYVCLPNPGYGLDEIFGVRAESGPETIHEDGLALDWNGLSIGCVVHRQHVSIGSAETIARYSDGLPAILDNRFGNGRAILVTTYPGIATERGCGDAGELISGLAGHIGVSPRVSTSCRDVWVRLQRNEAGLMAFIVNMSKERREVSVHIAEDLGVISDVDDMLQAENTEVANNRFNVSVDGHDARLLRLHIDILSHKDDLSTVHERKCAYEV